MDRFASLFDHFTPTARAFFAGNACKAVNFEHPDHPGYLHIFRGGRMKVSSAHAKTFELADPALLLLPRESTHSFVPDPVRGADLICATIQIGGSQGNPLALSLPDLIVIPFSKVPTLGPTLDLMQSEAFATLDGRQVALDRLFEYLIVQLVRHIVEEGSITGGALAGLADPRLAHALTALHEAPAKSWTLDDLAEKSGMSRTRFAALFRETVGVTPIDYLARWRMTVAQNLLRKGKPIKSVASAAGYESPAALSRAFSKIVGTTPREWQTQSRSSADDGD